jgi:hypothetical protein
MAMTKPEPLHGSVLPRRPARLLGAKEVNALIAKVGEEDEPEDEETDDDRRTD